jgi:thiol-disulfide isomerase/thioredoxin
VLDGADGLQEDVRMKGVSAGLVVAALLVAALPALGATLSEQLTAAQGLVKADQYPKAVAGLHVLLAEIDKVGLENLAPEDQLVVAETHKLLMGLAYDAAVKSGKLEGHALKEAKKWRREVLGVKAMKIIAHGEEIDLAKELVPGKTCIVDFFSVFCGPCMQIAPYLEELVDGRDDLFLVKVDINRPDQQGIDWGSPAAKQFKLESIPALRVYDGDGKLVAEGDAGRDKVFGMLQAMGE